MSFIDYPKIPLLFDDSALQSAAADWYFKLVQAISEDRSRLEQRISQLESNATDMAREQRTLAQSSPGANTLTTLYSCSQRKKIENGRVLIANRDKNATAFRVSVAVAGAADSQKQYIHYDVGIAARETRESQGVIALQAMDVVRVQSANGKVSFTLIGEEVDV